MVSDFFEDRSNLIVPSRIRRSPALLRLIDAGTNLRLWGKRRAIVRAARQHPSRRVLLAAVEVPGREADLRNVITKLSRDTHHRVDAAICPMAPVGKFDNITQALSSRDVRSYDWLIIVDDDVAFGKNFLDIVLHLSEKHDLRIAQPAHQFHSYSTFKVTERHWGSMVRETGFVEIGPISLLHRETFDDLLPFPSLRWAWGLDVLWSHVAARRGWRMGVIDATPLRHLRPVGKSYDWRAARAEAEAFMQRHDLTMSAAEIFARNSRVA
ncbi:hypothetical protein ACRAWG_26280 [Methylobacterium sp. P31]